MPRRPIPSTSSSWRCGFPTRGVARRDGIIGYSGQTFLVRGNQQLLRGRNMLRLAARTCSDQELDSAPIPIRAPNDAGSTSYMFLKVLNGRPVRALNVSVTPHGTSLRSPFVPLGAPVYLAVDRPETCMAFESLGTRRAVRGTRTARHLLGIGPTRRDPQGGMSASGSPTSSYPGRRGWSGSALKSGCRLGSRTRPAPYYDAGRLMRSPASSPVVGSAVQRSAARSGGNAVSATLDASSDNRLRSGSSFPAASSTFSGMGLDSPGERSSGRWSSRSACRTARRSCDRPPSTQRAADRRGAIRAPCTTGSARHAMQTTLQRSAARAGDTAAAAVCTSSFNGGALRADIA